VQNGVWYCPQLAFMGFDVCGWVCTQGSDASEWHNSYLGFDEAMRLCQDAGIMFVEPLHRGTLSELMDMSCEFESSLPARFGLPPLPSPNLAE